MLSPMRKITAIVFVAASVAGTASAAPVADAVAIRNAVPATTEAVWWGGWGWWGPAAGFAAGAIIGGALTAPYYYHYPYYSYGYGPGYYAYGYPYYGGHYYPPAAAPGYGYAPQAGNGYATNCAERFRSFDPATGTYLGYDGQRHHCP
jgi:hypothetical protein